MGTERPFLTEEAWAGREGLAIIYDVIVPRPPFPAPCYCVPLLGDAGSFVLGGWNRETVPSGRLLPHPGEA